MHFFATQYDQKEALHEIESRRPLKYVEGGMFETNDIREYYSVEELPTLGQSQTGNHQTDFYVILDREKEINVEKFKLNSGKIAYCVYPGGREPNPTSIEFFPSGFYDNQYLISGHFGTIHKNKESQSLHNLFARTFRKHFVKINGFYVGKEVLKLPENIRLCTYSYRETPDMDLTIPMEFKNG
jgi:hypothetical protein